MIATFYIKGTCVDDLFHILINNGYAVQMCNTEIYDTYRVDVILKNKEDNE